MSSNFCCSGQYCATSNAPLLKYTDSPHVRYMDEYVYAPKSERPEDSRQKPLVSDNQRNSFQGFRAHSMRGQEGQVYRDRLRKLPRKNMGFTGMLRRIKYKITGDSKKISGLVRKTSQAFREKCQEFDLRKYSTAARAPNQMSHEASMHFRNGEEPYPYGTEEKSVDDQEPHDLIVPSRSQNPDLPDIWYEAAPIRVPHRKDTAHRRNYRTSRGSKQINSLPEKVTQLSDHKDEEQPMPIRTTIINGRVADMALGYVRYHDELTESELEALYPALKRNVDSHLAGSSLDEERNPWRQRGISDSTSGSAPAPAPPVLRPQHLPSVSTTADQKAWRLSDSFHTASGNTKENSRNSSDDYHSCSAANPENVLQRRVHDRRVMQKSGISSRSLSRDTGDDTKSRSTGVIRPSKESEKLSTKDSRRYHGRSCEIANADAEAVDDRSLHLYNMRISKTLASQTSLVSMTDSKNHCHVDSHLSSLHDNPSLGAYHSSLAHEQENNVKRKLVDKIPRRKGSSFNIWDDTLSPMMETQGVDSFKINSHQIRVSSTQLTPPGNEKQAKAPKMNRRNGRKDRSTDTSISDSALQLLDNLSMEARKTGGKVPTPSGNDDDVFNGHINRGTGEDQKLHHKSFAASMSNGSLKNTGMVTTGRSSYLLDGSKDEAAILWERALLAHAAQQASRPEKPNRRDVISQTGNKAANLNTNIREEANNPKHRSSQAPTNRPHELDRSDRIPAETQKYRQSDSSKDLPQRYHSEQYGKPHVPNNQGAWSRYPSHTKRDRSATAGASDHVLGRDFAPRPLSDPTIQEPGDFKQHHSSKKPRNMNFAKEIFKSWGRLNKTRSTDLRRSEAGHRSSIAVGGLLEYPELELLPPALPDTNRQASAQTATSSDYNNGGHSSLDGYMSSINKSFAKPDRARNARLSAEAWAEMYQQHLPDFSEGAPKSASTSVSSEASYKNKLTKEELSFLSYPPTRSIATEKGSPKTPAQFQQDRLDALRELERAKALKCVEDLLNIRD